MRTTGDEDEWHAYMVNVGRTEHEINDDEEVWHYCYWRRGLLVALLVESAKTNPFAPDRIVSEVL